MQLEALYYPYASVQDMGFLKSALLYFDKLWVISSESAVYHTGGEFRELLEDRELVEPINGEWLANRYQPVLLDAISTDLSDSAFLDLTQRPGYVWELYGDKGLAAVGDLVRPLEWREERAVVPYEQGTAFLFNMALIATTNPTPHTDYTRRLTPLTDREEHFSILRYKLGKGAKGQLERLYGDTLEESQREAVISIIGRRLVETVLPMPGEMQDIPLERIKEFRDRYREDRDKLRDRLLLMMEEVISEEPTISPARLRMRIEALANTERRRLAHDRHWSTRIRGGLRTVLGAVKEGTRELVGNLMAVPTPWGLAGAISAASAEVVGYIDQQASQLTMSDIAYLYRIRREFR